SSDVCSSDLTWFGGRAGSEEERLAKAQRLAAHARVSVGQSVLQEIGSKRAKSLKHAERLRADGRQGIVGCGGPKNSIRRQQIRRHRGQCGCDVPGAVLRCCAFRSE